MLSETQKQIVSFCIGGVAGCAAKSVVAPIDRVKILLQGHNPLYHNVRPLWAFVTVARVDGLAGFFQGNCAQMVRIFPYAAIQYFAYGELKKCLHAWGWDSSHGAEKLLCGALAGMAAATFTYPLDLVRARLAFQNRHSQANKNATAYQHVSYNNLQQHRGIFATISRIVRTEGGVTALYRGLSATLLGMAPYAGISFFAYEKLKGGLVLLSTRSLSSRQASSSSSSATLSTPNWDWPSIVQILVVVRNSSSEDSTAPAVVNLTVYGRLVCGAIAGLVAQTIAYPLDVTRRRMQLIPTLHPESSTSPSLPWYSILRDTFQKYGLSYGLYRGVSLNFVRVTPMVAMSFTTYETLCHWAEIPSAT